MCFVRDVFLVPFSLFWWLTVDSLQKWHHYLRIGGSDPNSHAHLQHTPKFHSNKTNAISTTRTLYTQCHFGYYYISLQTIKKKATFMTELIKLKGRHKIITVLKI